MSALTLPSVLRDLFRLLTSCGVLALLWLAFGSAAVAMTAPEAPTQTVSLTEPAEPAPAAALPAAPVLDDTAQPGAALDGEQEQRLEPLPAGPGLPARGSAWLRPAPAPLHHGPAPRGLLRPPDA